MDNDTHHQSQSVIIAGLNTGDSDYDYSMVELAELAQADGMDVVDRFDQKIDKPNPATYFGEGKVDELADTASVGGIKTIITNDELTPSQLRNLEDETNCQVMDRTALILDIFAKRAQTREAKIQVEIAQLQYELPRLETAENVRLDQQAGGGSSLNNRGAGETKLELNRRTIQQRISKLRGDLKKIQRSENTKRRRRDKSAIPTAALVGYTNSGKSTIMNGLLKMYGSSDKSVMVKDMLFATLDTSVRQLTLPDSKRFLISDTVGFIGKLPTTLIEAFKSTLNEAANADLLVQVIDYSDPHYKEMMATTQRTLKEIGIDDIPMINIFNKADKTTVAYPAQDGENSLIISAHQSASLQALARMIRGVLFKDFVDAELLVPFSDGDVVSYLNEHTNITKTQYEANGTRLRVEMSPADYQRFQQYVVGQ